MTDNELQLAFLQKVARLRNQQIVFIILGLLILITLWISNYLKFIDLRIIDNISAEITLQYIAILTVGFGIWYGSYNYDKTAEILKSKENVDEKQNFYLKAKNFQFILQTIVFGISLLCFVLTAKDVFALLMCIVLIFAFITLPSFSKFENDFYKPIFLDEEEEV